MRPVPPGQAIFSAALTAAAVALINPTVPFPSAAPAPVAFDAAVARPARTAEQPALPDSRAFAYYRDHRPARHAAPPGPARTVPRASDHLEAARLVPVAKATPSRPRPATAPKPGHEAAAASRPSYSELASHSGAYAPVGGTSSFQACVISRESGGNSQVMNASGHYGLYPFSYSTWVAHGGNPADFGHASVAEQNRVFANTVAQDGHSDWSPYDGCL
jgi:hypothetical protein